MMLDYNAAQIQAQALQQDLIATHMRTAISIPAHRHYVVSCYPSEPLLAEAGCRLLASWRAEDPNIVIETVNAHYSRGLLHRGDAGELVARMLLMSAYLQACEKEVDMYTHYSKGCTVRTFLQSLFHRAGEALVSVPDNIFTDGPGTNLNEALGDAIVRFTHFAKFDSLGTSWLGVHAAALRGAAIVCRNGEADVDLIVPIIIPTEGAVCRHVVTAILIQIKRRQRAGNPALLAIDESKIQLFPFPAEDCKCPNSRQPLTGSIDLKTLPYISLVLDLGVQRPVPAHLRGSVKFDHTKNAGSGHTSKSKKESLTTSASVSRFSTGTPPARSSRRNLEATPKMTHPRYSIYVSGLSSKNYVAINSDNETKYKMLLRQSHILADHPRQKSNFISQVVKLMPTSAGGDAFSWLNEKSTSGFESNERDEFEVGLAAYDALAVPNDSE